MNRLGCTRKLIIVPRSFYASSSQAQSTQTGSQLEICKQVAELRVELTESLIADRKPKKCNAHTTSRRNTARAKVRTGRRTYTRNRSVRRKTEYQTATIENCSASRVTEK
jgi:hypothetical protein